MPSRPTRRSGRHGTTQRQFGTETHLQGQSRVMRVIDTRRAGHNTGRTALETNYL